MQGWIKLHRQIQESALWKQKRVFSKAEAWIDILMEVQHTKETEVIIGSKVLKCYRGQSLRSAETWGKRWCWSRNQVIRFFKLLKDCAQIATVSEQITTRLTVLNYDAYQNEQTVCELKVNTKRTASEHRQECKNAKNGKNEKKRARAVFKKPTGQEVTEYAGSIGFVLDGPFFVDKYDAIGWKINGNPMKDWKATVRTWKRREPEFRGKNGRQTTKTGTRKPLPSTGDSEDGGDFKTTSAIGRTVKV